MNLNMSVPWKYHNSFSYLGGLSSSTRKLTHLLKMVASVPTSDFTPPQSQPRGRRTFPWNCLLHRIHHWHRAYFFLRRGIFFPFNFLEGCSNEVTQAFKSPGESYEVWRNQAQWGWVWTSGSFVMTSWSGFSPCAFLGMRAKFWTHLWLFPT